MSALTQIDLFYNLISILAPTAFSSLSSLSVLSLYGNLIVVIPAGIFAGLANLTNIQLQSNTPFLICLPRCLPVLSPLCRHPLLILRLFTVSFFFHSVGCMSTVIPALQRSPHRYFFHLYMPSPTYSNPLSQVLYMVYINVSRFLPPPRYSLLTFEIIRAHPSRYSVLVI